MANFQIWPVEKLREFIAFSGATPHGHEHDALLIQTVQIHSTNNHLAQQFENRGHQGFQSAPVMSNNAPYPPFPGGPGAPAAGNPYSDPRASGPSYPAASAPSYPPAGAPSYPPAGSAYPSAGPPAQSAYPDVDFAAGAGGAPAPAAQSPYPPYMGMAVSPATATAPGAPHHGHGAPSGHPHRPAAASSPFPAPSAPGHAAPTPSGYPGQSGPVQPTQPSPYPMPGASYNKPAPAASPYPSAAAPHHNPSPAPHNPSPYPVPGAPNQAQAPHNPSPYPVPGAPNQAQAPHNPSPYPVPGAPNPSPAPHNPSPYPVPGAPNQAPSHTPSPYPTPSANSHKVQHAPSPYPGPAAPSHQASHAPYPAHGAPPQQPRQQAHGSPSGGRKKALLIGCNYPGTSAELRGCCTDVQHVEYLLRSRFGFEDITVLRDDQHDRAHMPTRNNILRHMDSLVRGASAGDSLFFHFSGHGSQKRDWSGDESDGMNETICPSDFKHAGQILDDELNKRLVNPLGQGVRLHALLDACHSGTGMDLSHITKVDRRSGGIRWKAEPPTRKYKGTKGGLAVQFGACKDSQTAADTASLSGGTHTGAATFLFIQACERLIKHQQPLTYASILRDMLHQIEEFNKKNGRASGGGGLGGGLAGLAMGAIMGAVTGHGLSGAVTGAMSALSGGSLGGQTPQLSSSQPLDLDMQLQI